MSLVGFQARNHPQQAVKSFVDDRETDPEMFEKLHERFQFTIDVAASAHNGTCLRVAAYESFEGWPALDIFVDHGSC